ncbi:MAG: hypothetical protein ABIK28_10130 [Planctomycetota bacterium]
MFTYRQKQKQKKTRDHIARTNILSQGERTVSLNRERTHHLTGAMTELLIRNPFDEVFAIHNTQPTQVLDYFSLGMPGLLDASTRVNQVFSIEIRPVQVSPVLTPAEMLNTVRDVFTLNVTDAARAFLVTRPTIYQWASLDDISQIRARNVLKRMKELYGLAIKWKSLGPLTGRWANMPLRDCSGQSVVDLLTADPIDHQAVLGAHAQLKAASAQLRQAEIDRSVKAVKALEGAFTRMDELLQVRERGRS